MNTYDDIAELIRKSEVSFAHAQAGVSQAAIDKAEADLELKLPPSYRWWLLRYGGGQVGGDILYGIDEGDYGRPDIVKLANRNDRKERAGRQKLVFMIGNEEQFFFDTRSQSPDGEYPVYLWDHQQGEPFLYAPTFAEFLRRRIGELAG